jgi:hypothetical protein
VSRRDQNDYLEEVGAIVKALASLGLNPVLVGGMALVILGSRRVTRDFDFVISKPAERLDSLIDLFYERGLELASRLGEDGEVTATIDNAKVASARLRLDVPASAYFVNPTTGLRIDLLFDFPIAAKTLLGAATRTKIRSYVFHIASEKDLLRLKKIARARRSSPGDVQDIAFLEARRKASR